MNNNEKFLREHMGISMEGFLTNARKSYLSSLSEDQILYAINSACDYFHIPYPVIIQNLTNYSGGCTMFVDYNPRSYGDDVLCYNMHELAKLNVGTQDAFSLIMTHECAHRVLQGTRFEGPNNGRWQNELAADFLMGTRAGFFDIKSISYVIEGLGKTGGSDTHPKGWLRANFIRHGVDIALQLKKTNQPVSLEKLMAEYHAHYRLLLPSIKQDEKEFFNT